MTLDEMIEDAEESPEEDELLEEEEEEEQDPLSEDEETEDEEESEETEDDSDDEEEESDEDEEETDTDTSEDSEETFTVTISGSEVEVTREQLLQYAQRGADVNEDNSLAEEKVILAQAGLSAEDLKILAEVKGGSKEALAKLAQRNSIDVLDVENEMAGEYKPTQEYHVPTEVDRVAGEIMSDPELAENFRGEVDRIRDVGPEFVKLISENPNALRDFSSHVRSGLASKVIPLAINKMKLEGGPFAKHYASIGQQMENASKAPEKRQVSKREQDMRKKASAGNSGRAKHSPSDSDDIFEMSDADFNDMLGEPSFS